jgi:hypothetical protein
MQSGSALLFTDIFLEEMLKQNPDPIGSFVDFINLLKMAFQDCGATVQAQQILVTFHKGTIPIDKYFTKLKLLFREANIEDKKEKI